MSIQDDIFDLEDHLKDFPIEANIFERLVAYIDRLEQYNSELTRKVVAYREIINDL